MKRHLLKSMLVGAMVIGASSVWADNLTLTPSETTVIWASGNSENTENGDKNFYEASASEWLCTQANISGGKLNNQNANYGGSYVVITKFDCSETLAGMNIQKATLSFNSVCTVSGKNSNVIVSSIGTDWDATTVTWNNMDRTVTQISGGTGQNVKTSTKTLTEDVTTLLSDDEDKIVAFAIYTYTAREQKITNIQLLVEAVDAASSANVTLRYVDGEGQELKTAVAVGSSGNTLTLTDEQKANFFVGETKYIYVSDNSADIIINSDGSSVITLTYREAEAWTYTLNAVDGDNNVLQALISATALEGEKVNVGYAAYINVEGSLWSTGKSYSNDGKGFQTSVTLSENNVVKNLTYTNKGISGEVVYLSEGENIDGMTVCSSSNSTIRSSGSAAAYAPADVTFTTLPAGHYELSVICFDAQKNPNSDWTFKAGDEIIASIHCGTINYYEAPAVEFTLYKESDITIAKGGGNSIGIDLTYIVKTGDVTQEDIAKAALQDAIAQAILLNTFANDADLANAIAAAQDAVNDDAATMMSLAAAGKALNDAALVAAKSTLQEVVELAESFGIDVTAANAVLNNENASVEDYALVLQNLAEVAKPEIANYIALANKFLETFDKAALEALANDIADFNLTVAGNDFGAIKEAMTALMKKASTYVQADMKKVFTYLGAMEDETLNADIADFQAAVGAYLLGGKNMKEVFTVGIKLAEDFVKAAPTYIEKVQALVAEYKNQGKDVSALETAITDALTALGSEEADVVAKGEAIYNLIQAVEAFKVTVGISEVSIASESAPVFNMAGQRVAAPVKGINIINGKKVIIK